MNNIEKIIEQKYKLFRQSNEGKNVFSDYIYYNSKNFRNFLSKNIKNANTMKIALMMLIFSLNNLYAMITVFILTGVFHGCYYLFSPSEAKKRYFAFHNKDTGLKEQAEKYCYNYFMDNVINHDFKLYLESHIHPEKYKMLSMLYPATTYKNVVYFSNEFDMAT